MHKRNSIVHGDTTTVGGKVEASTRTHKHHGAYVARAGDKVWCPSCSSYGVIQCVPPFNLKLLEGKQAALDGDLCVCHCSSPPRLVASLTTVGQSYEASSVLADAASAGWLAHAGLVTETEHHDEQFMFRDSHGAPMANMAYTAKFKSTGEVIHGMTDDTGQTERLKSKAAGPDDIEIIWGHQ